MTPSQYRPRVLFVDDDPAILRALSGALKLSCEVVACVDNGEQGIETAVKLMPDVIVIDLTMPEMDGLEVCRVVKTLLPEIDVIICTAQDTKPVKEAAFQAGASGFVAKSTALGALESVILRLGDKGAPRAIAM